MEPIAFRQGTILRMSDSIKGVIIDSYALDAKNIRIIAVKEDFDICILTYNIDTNEYSDKCYDTVQIIAELRAF